ncbi:MULTISPECIES: hypothetical protein [unclassified Streptomyces]
MSRGRGHTARTNGQAGLPAVQYGDQSAETSAARHGLRAEDGH